jgi:hypothetical protein
MRIDTRWTADWCLSTRRPHRRGVKVEGRHNIRVFGWSYEQMEVLSSSPSPYTVASFLLVDFGIVDATTGAWMKYPERLTIVLEPNATPSGQPMARR